MSRRLLLQASFIGADVTNVEIFHTTASAENKLAANVSPSVLADTGIEVDAPDNATLFFARVLGGVCQLVTGSLTVQNNDVTKRFFTFKSADQGGDTSHFDNATYVVSVNTQEEPLATFGGNEGPASSVVAHNYEEGDTVTVVATPVYPNTFFGYYSGSTQIESETTLTIGINDFTGSNSTARDIIIGRAGVD
jgi:hypothetical protein|tara:strand:+ start:352 stop:930 length:579 start_codon:yes stop_codon:yes gene_type:complete